MGRVCTAVVLLIVLFLPFVAAALPDQAGVAVDLPQIRERGKLIAITSYGDTTYFLYRGEPMGFEYELLRRLAADLGLRLDIVLAKDLDEMIDMLERGRGDIVACGLTVTKTRAQQLDFAEHYATTREVLVQRKPENWRDLKPHEIDARLIRNPIDLIGKDVYVRKGSAYIGRLENLSEEVGGDIRVTEADDDVTTEELMAQVAEGKIDYTVVDEHIALFDQAYYPDIDVATPVSFPQRLAWAVRRGAPELVAAVNNWTRTMRGSPEFAAIYAKYFAGEAGFKPRMDGDSAADAQGGPISEYDAFLKEHAEEIPWDWRLLAALIYQESRFDPQAKSWSGAVGLMQLMPKTGKAFGARNLEDPYENIRAGTNYLRHLTAQWADISDPEERVKFVLASYTVGKGHVDDARRLARKHGKDTHRWDGHVGEYMAKLSKDAFFTDKVVKCGYCPGERTSRYVKQVLDRFQHYKKLPG